MSVKGGHVSWATAENADAVIGRDPELEAVTTFLDRVAAGPVALALRGEPGIGKSTIWHAAVDRAEEATYLVLACRPSSAETNLPYAGLADLFAAVDNDVLHGLPAPQRRALDVALLRVDAGSAPLHQRAVSAATLQVLVDLARSTPLVVAIDDLQWLDPPTVHVLRFALRRVAPARVGALVASRSGVVDDDRLGLVDAFPSSCVDRLTVGPLDLSALDNVLQSRLGTAFLGPTLRQLHETSGGNPLFALELGRSLLDPDANHVAGQAFPAPSTLPELLAARLARISPLTRHALFAAAALARPTVDVVLAATETDGVTLETLEQAVRADVIGIHAGALRFMHPLLSSVVYAEPSDEARRRLHRRLADLVADPEEQARHLGLSAEGPDRRIADTLERAARRAAARGAPDAAAVLLEQAVDVTPLSCVDDVLRRRLDAVDQHIAAGETARADQLLEQTLATTRAGPSRARALHRRARVTTLAGDFLAVPPLLKAALEEVGEDVELRAAIERDLVWSLAQVGAVSALLPHASAALKAAEACGDPVLIAEAMNHLCFSQCVAGGDVDPDLLERALRFDEEVADASPPQHRAIASGRLTLALTLKWVDDFDRARELLEAMRTSQAEHGDEAALLPVLFHLGELECWAGDCDAAARIAKECHDLALRSDQAVAELRALTLDAMVACARSTDDAVSVGMAALELAEVSGDWPAIIRILKSLGAHELALGNVDAAVGHLMHGVVVERSSGFDQRTVRIIPDAVEALVAAERTAEAAPIVAEFERRAGPWAAATGARCRGLLDAASGNLPAALVSLERAMQEHDRVPRPFERARTLLCLGSVQRRARQQRAARESLEEARRLFLSVGSIAWADRASAELKRIAGRASNRLALTPTEEQVAKLVADGLTNAEVAAAMFISIKTVEANLTRIYRKLGLSSRRELARHVREASPSGV
jgi:DNA-binding CsgD family transcriptional regulator